MALIDPSTPVGKVRLRVGDYTDLTIFPDSVYQTALDDHSGNVLEASKLMAQYILGSLSMRVHEKLAVIEIYGNQFVDNYVKFLKTTVLNPAFMQSPPIPYAAGMDVTHPILQFQEDWNNNYVNGTEAQQLHDNAVGFNFSRFDLR